MTTLADVHSHAITPEQFLAADAAVLEAKREKEDAAAAYARATKAAKNSAVDLKAYKLVQMFRQLDDDEQLVVARHFIQYLQWLEMPVGTQFSMIDAPKMPPIKAKAKLEHELFLAGELGLKAGRQGEADSADPFPPASEKSIVWRRRHADGLTERATAAKMGDGADDDTPPVADNARATAEGTVKRRPGRPSSSARAGVEALHRARKHLDDSAVH